MASRAPVLVPLDGSEAAEEALMYAEAVAKATDHPLRLISVIGGESGGLFGVSEEVQHHLEQGQRESAMQYLAAKARELEQRGVQVSTRLVTGDPAHQLVAAAQRGRVPMVVMATHGRGGLQRWLIGSVADKVMRLNTRPTLLVHAQEQAAPHPRRVVTLQRLMVPLDGSPLAEQALTQAVHLARALAAQLVLVRVQPYFTTWEMSSGYTPYIVGVDETLVDAAKQYLQTARTRVPADVPVETHLLRDAPALVLAEFAQQQAIDLIVMATHGRGGLRRVVLGSVADRLLHAQIPVLLIRPAVTAGKPQGGRGNGKDRAG